MEPEGSSPHSQAPATCPYPEPAQSSPHTHIQQDALTYLLTYLITHSLTPRSRVLLEKPTRLQLVKKFPEFYGTRRFITTLFVISHSVFFFFISFLILDIFTSLWNSYLNHFIWHCLFRNGWTYFRETWSRWILGEVIERFCLWLNWMNVQTLGVKTCIYLCLHFHKGLAIISCERQKKVLLTFRLYWKRRLLNPSQPSDAMWHHNFHLSLLCMSFAHWFH
jgi:hypothetical protein